MNEDLDSPLERLVDAVMDQPNQTPELWNALEVFVKALLANEAISLRDAAMTLGKAGGQKGGIARAAKLSPARRHEIAVKAARVRWGKT